jgi:hypothetical protein
MTELSLEKQVLQDVASGKTSKPRTATLRVQHARQQYGLSERRGCRLVGQGRGTQRYRPTQRHDEDGLTRAIIQLASQYGRCYGYRRIAEELRKAAGAWARIGCSGSGGD